MIFELKYFCGSTEGSSSQTPIKGTSKGYNGFLYDFFLVLVKPPLIFLFIGSFTQYTMHFDHIRPITFWLSLPRCPRALFPSKSTYLHYCFLRPREFDQSSWHELPSRVDYVVSFLQL